MRKWIAMTVVVLVGGGVAGCTPGGDPTPGPSVVPVTPSPVESPSPTWTVAEQQALDAVLKYLEVSNDIEQHLADADWNRIRDVASDPAVNDALLIWTQWNMKGWHMEGAPVFEPDYINRGMMDQQGNRYHVHGCYDITQAHLVDRDGNQVGERGVDRGPIDYLVLFLGVDGSIRVIEDNAEEGTC